MVLKEKEYSSGIVDVDLIAINYAHLKEQLKTKNKKGKKKQTSNDDIFEEMQSDDVFHANSIAQKLVQALELPQHVHRTSNSKPESPDFLFQGEGYYDPGKVVQWREVIPDLTYRLVEEEDIEEEDELHQGEDDIESESDEYRP